MRNKGLVLCAMYHLTSPSNGAEADPSPLQSEPFLAGCFVLESDSRQQEGSSSTD